MTSGSVADALDLKLEDPDTVKRYGSKYNNLLIARRLVEAGTRVVTIQSSGWDPHSNNIKTLKNRLSELDMGVSALLTDLSERGLEQDVTLIVWGEFGRTPRINPNGGRDHWTQVSCAYMAGGGMKNGQAIGSTNRLGEHAHSRPVHVQEIFATLYHNLGIDTSATTVVDPTGRPQYLTQMDPIAELV